MVMGERICNLCMHRCRLNDGQTGRCRARKNADGKVICGNYGKITSLALDPIEKKPLRKFFPGSRILSVGSYGCNLSCPFCQNHEISMKREEEVQSVYISPQALCERALQMVPYGNIGVAFTYNEPMIGYEYVRDTARCCREEGLKTAVVTNGSVFLEETEEIFPLIDAWNIDLKGFTEQYYRKLGGSLEIVKEFIFRANEYGHVELTTLIVPGENDKEEEMRAMASWIASVDPEIELHVTRFFPNWNMQDRGPTSVEQVYHLAETAGRYLENVYTGNC